MPALQQPKLFPRHKYVLSAFFAVEQSDTCRVDAALDPGGETLGLDPDANPFLDACDPTCNSSDCTRGFPSGYHPALEHQRQGIDEVGFALGHIFRGTYVRMYGCIDVYA